jgi:hypothetical protein
MMLQAMFAKIDICDEPNKRFRMPVNQIMFKGNGEQSVATALPEMFNCQTNVRVGKPPVAGSTRPNLLFGGIVKRCVFGPLEQEWKLDLIVGVDTNYEERQVSSAHPACFEEPPERMRSADAV